MYPVVLFKGTLYEMSIWQFVMSHSFLIVLAWLIVARPKDFPVSRAGLFFAACILYTAGIVGAKLLWMFINRERLFAVWGFSFGYAFLASGYAFMGAIPAQMAAMALFTKLRTRRVSFWDLMDYFMPFILLHQAFVRIGCFLSGCCSGKITLVPWGCRFKGEAVARHPTQIYEMIYIVIIFSFVRHLYKQRYSRGTVFFATMGIYSAARFFNEFFRSGSPEVLWIFTQAQIGVAATVALCASVLLVINSSGGGKHENK